MSSLSADIWADLVAWALTTAPVVALHHWALRRHMTKITSRQTAVLTGPQDGRTS